MNLHVVFYGSVGQDVFALESQLTRTLALFIFQMLSLHLSFKRENDRKFDIFVYDTLFFRCFVRAYNAHIAVLRPPIMHTQISWQLCNKDRSLGYCIFINTPRIPCS